MPPFKFTALPVDSMRMRDSDGHGAAVAQRQFYNVETQTTTPFISIMVAALLLAVEAQVQRAWTRWQRSATLTARTCARS